MFCLKCGKEIENDAKFCPHCGAAASSQQAREPAAPSTPEAPVYTIPDFSGAGSSPVPGGQKRRGAGLLIGGITAAVLVVALVVMTIGGLFSSPKGQVEKALAKTVAAYAEAKSKAGAPDLKQLVQDRSYSQRFSLELSSINEEMTGWYGMSSLKGLGMRVGTDYDQKDRKMDFDMAAFWDGEDLASFQMLVDNNKMSFASPEFTKGSAYGFNTETLGADLERLGAWDENVDIKKIGFNLFDLMEKAAPSDAQTKEMEKIMAEAYQELFDAIEVEQDGKKSVQVNGKKIDAALYHMVVPEGAMLNYIDAVEDAMEVVDSTDMIRDILQSMGFDQAAINEFTASMDGTDIYGGMAASLKESVTAIGDLELDVYVSGGCVCAVEYSGQVEGGKLAIGLYLGGGGNYVDDLSLEIADGNHKIIIESSGDHAGKNGVFTDKTTIRAGSGRITSELRYEPKALKDNFEWELKIDNTASVSMEGQLTTTKDSFDLHLDDLSIKAMGTKLLSMEADYYLGPCKGMQVSMPSPKLLGGMDEDDLLDLIYELAENAEEWTYDVQDRIPPDLLYDLY